MARVQEAQAVYWKRRRAQVEASDPYNNPAVIVVGEGVEVKFKMADVYKSVKSCRGDGGTFIYLRDGRTLYLEPGVQLHPQHGPVKTVLEYRRV